MQRACDIGKKNKLDKRLRRYVLSFAAVFCVVGLVAGYYGAVMLVTNEAVVDSPVSEKMYLTSFIAVSGAAAFMIIGAFVGSTIYRFKGRGERNGE